ncbi:Domain of uncharacterised function (DUF2825) [Chromobacterium violaceum]|nr:Domain of uncharacterised function (DUF2825) [Chromobacterium violaceum]
MLFCLRCSNDRFIPTYVGNTSSQSRQASCQPVHPHVRGEHYEDEAEQLSELGSSPRTWGTHIRQVYTTSLERFIPTYVGNTRPWWLYSARITVHPHVRGEHLITCEGVLTVNGSSPRTWGTPGGAIGRGGGFRFIPTYVGNTQCHRLRPGHGAVHPHVRGEHIGFQVNGLLSSGSSPRTWGTHAHNRARLIPTRFIPTYVGNTTRRFAGCEAGAVHPHVRGEHGKKHRREEMGDGSSPRAWGAPRFRRRAGSGRRFIPTCVGSTASTGEQPRTPPVHPHVRGGARGGRCLVGFLLLVHPHVRGGAHHFQATDF